MPATDYDIVIAGGGMIGTSLALALAGTGLDIAVVEAVERGAESQPSFDDAESDERFCEKQDFSEKPARRVTEAGFL